MQLSRKHKFCSLGVGDRLNNTPPQHEPIRIHDFPTARDDDLRINPWQISRFYRQPSEYLLRKQKI